MYKFTCVCGKDLAVATPEGECPECKRGYALTWPAPINAPSAPKTISEKYEAK